MFPTMFPTMFLTMFPPLFPTSGERYGKREIDKKVHLKKGYTLISIRGDYSNSILPFAERRGGGHAGGAPQLSQTQNL